MIESAVIMLVIFVLTAWAYYQDVIVGKLEFRRSRAYFGLIAAVVSYPLLTLALRYFDSIPGSWDNDTVKILVLAMAALLVIAVVLVLVHREVERKRATLLQVSRRLGFSYDPEGSSPLSPGLRQVPALESLQRVTHVFRSKEQVYESVSMSSPSGRTIRAKQLRCIKYHVRSQPFS